MKSENLNAIVKAVEEVFEGKRDVEVTVQTVEKNNGVVLTGIMVKEKTMNVAPTVYVDGFLTAIENGEMEVEDAAFKVAHAIEEGMPSHEVRVDWYTKWETVRDKVQLRLVNAHKNEQRLADMPHRALLDMQLIYCCDFEDSQIGKGSITVHDSHMKQWGVTEEDLYEAARVNTRRVSQVRVIPMEKVLMELMGGPGRDDDEGDKFDFDYGCFPMLIVTNRSRVYGACGILYEDVCKKISEAFDGDFFILPSSVHEVIVLKNEGRGDELLEMVKEVNATQVDPQDVLSDAVYYYDAKSGTIRAYGDETVGKFEPLCNEAAAAEVGA
ncbi:MAG: hypothetical protein IKO41_03730 [Lachnospiraceae bacterium]|nr:hypothetical protein [Lachnospiraceae bacterium]